MEYKIQGQTDREFLLENVNGFACPSFLSYDGNIIESVLRGKIHYDQDTPATWCGI